MAKEHRAFQRFGFVTLIAVSKPMPEKVLMHTLSDTALDSVDTQMHHVGLDLTPEHAFQLHAGPA